jgi:hypothetical protein
MAVAGLRDILEAMRVQIQAMVDAAAPSNIDVQVEKGIVVNPTPPTIDMWPGAVSRETESAAFDDIYGGYLITVRARVATGDTDAGQDLLLRFMDDTDELCIAAALDTDPTLNGNASSLTMRDPTGYTLFPDSGGDGALLGFSFTAVVLAGKS